MLSRISVHGARQHNLKNIDVEIPRNTLTVITGLSGSGKSSLAFDTIYAEGQRRYVETLSPYARQFLDQMERPEVDSIEGLSPAISIEQKTTSRSPRSTVGTITEIYDYVRLLYSSIGVSHCPNCDTEISRQTTAQILERVAEIPENTRILILAPIVRGRKGEYKKELEKFARQGFVKARVDGVMRNLEDEIVLDKRKNHTIDVVVDKLVLKPDISKRLEASIETATKLADGLVVVSIVSNDPNAEPEERMYSQKMACPNCGTSVPVLEPRSFSFNSPYGACPECNGLGSMWSFDPDKIIVDETRPLFDGGLGPGAGSNYVGQRVTDGAWKNNIDLSKPWEKLSAAQREVLLNGGKGNYPGLIKLLGDSLEGATDNYREYLSDFMTARECPSCHGKRLQAASLAVRVKGMTVAEFSDLSIRRALAACRGWKLEKREEEIAGGVVGEIRTRLEFLENVGLDYLNMARNAQTLSGGEAQRIRLATQIGSQLRGVLYVLDEPSIGLHPRDNERLLGTLESLRDMGNTVLVVEHDQDTIERADFVIDLGPGAGRLGGEIVAQGTAKEIARNKNSLTGQYLSGTREIEVPAVRRIGNGKKLRIFNATEHNLKNVDAEFPLGMLVVVTGVSGSGKSTLVNDILYRSLAKHVYGSKAEPGKHERLMGLGEIDKVIEIDQGAIGRTPRSNPATYTQVFAPIRELFAMLPESRERGYKSGRFSFNVKGGRCEACQGDGLKRIEMNFLPDVYVTCDVCRGKRYNHETLQVKLKGKSIADLLDTTIEDAAPLLANLPNIAIKLDTLVDVGLGYLHLGQSSTTLSGGEAQRIKLAKELSKRQTGRTVYILDEPTTGLHFEDVRRLLEVLQKLVDLGNTVIVIEHNLDVIKSADWILDMGPEGGEGGGTLLASGTPEDIAKVKKSYTGQALVKLLRKAK
ncbi:excinuclease ABC subunit UvrA [Bryobacter aggregatus]|uniref:excinuclease ABC subunit UvrA n=1 Tax=Bryobacter aggregatus TaxID=360054 RepID=UPI0004E2604F|nr:excinuclease ABC subunit UvrA [Bryobacter aggregatus]